MASDTIQRGLEMRDGVRKARRSHRKSKTGCIGCKTRKVKCDENRPICNNCNRHGIDCVYRPVAPSATDSHVSPPLFNSSAISNGHSSEKTPGQLHREQHCYPSSAPPELNLLEMELLHNFTVYTAYTISRNPVLQNVYRTSIPTLAFSAVYVLRAILSLSALHIAHCRPAQRTFYVAEAQSQLDAALAIVTPLINDVNIDNVSAISCFSIFTSLIACAQPRSESTQFLFVGDSGVAEWLHLMRGSRYIHDTYQDALRDGPMGPIFRIGSRKHARRDALALPKDQHPLLNLKQFIIDRGEDAVLPDIIFALDELMKSYAICLNPDSVSMETSDVFAWIFQLSDEFLDLMVAKEQRALCVFAFYCPVIKVLEWMWLVQGWSTHLIQAIWDCLDQEHRAWIQWAVEAVGWVPS